MERKNAPCSIYTTLNLSKGKQLAKKKQASQTKRISYFEMKRRIAEEESKEKLKKEYEKTRIKNEDFLEKFYDKNREDVKEYYESNMNKLKMSGINTNNDADIDLNKTKTILLFGNKKKVKKLNMPLKMDSKFKLTPLPEKISNKIDEADLKKNEAKAKKMREIEYCKSLIEDKSKIIVKPDKNNFTMDFHNLYANYLDSNDPMDEDPMTRTSQTHKLRGETDDFSNSDYFRKRKGKKINMPKKKCNKSEDNHVCKKNKLKDIEEGQDYQLNKGDEGGKKVIGYEINYNSRKNSGKNEYEYGKGSVIIHESNNNDSNSNGNNSNKVYENTPYGYTEKIVKKHTDSGSNHSNRYEGSENNIFNSIHNSLGYQMPEKENNEILTKENNSEDEQNNNNENNFGTFNKDLKNTIEGGNEKNNIIHNIKKIDSREDSKEIYEGNQQVDNYNYNSNESLKQNKNALNHQKSNSSNAYDSYNSKYNNDENNNNLKCRNKTSSSDSLFDDVDINKVNSNRSSNNNNKNNKDINIDTDYNNYYNKEGYNDCPEKLKSKNQIISSENNNQERHDDDEEQVDKFIPKNSIEPSSSPKQIQLDILKDLSISKFNYELLSTNEHIDKLDHQHIFENIIPDKLNNYLFVSESKQNKDCKYTIDNASKFDILNSKEIQNDKNEYQIQKIDSIQLIYMNKNFNYNYLIEENIDSMEIMTNNDLKDNQILKINLFDKDTLSNIHQQDFSLLSNCQSPNIDNIIISTNKLPFEYYTKTTYIEPPINKIKKIQKKIKKLFALSKREVPSMPSYKKKTLQYTEASSLEILNSRSKVIKTKPNENNLMVIRSNSFDIAQKNKSDISSISTTTAATCKPIKITESTCKGNNILEDNEDLEFRKNRFRHKKDYINLFPKTPPNLSKFIDFKKLLPNYVKNKFYKTLFTILNYKSKEILFYAMDEFFYYLKVKINYNNINYTNCYVNADYSEISKIYYKKRVVNTSLNINNLIDKFTSIIRSVYSKDFFYRFVLIWLYKNGININNKYVFNLLFKGFSGNKYLYTLNNIFQLGITNNMNLEGDEQHDFINYIEKINDLDKGNNTKSDKHKGIGEESFIKSFSIISGDNQACNNSYDKIMVYDNKNKIINNSSERIKKIKLNNLKRKISENFENQNIKEDKDCEINGNENTFNLSNISYLSNINPIIYNKKILLSKNKDYNNCSNNAVSNYDMKDEVLSHNINSKCNSNEVSDKQSEISNAENNLKESDNNELINNQEDYLDKYSNDINFNNSNKFINNNEEEYL